MPRAQDKEYVRVEESKAPSRDIGNEFWGAVEKALGPTTTRVLRRVLEARGEVARNDLASLERALESMKELLGPKAGEILEEYAVRTLRTTVERGRVEP